jgi:S1-C subfamily serine protease
MVVASSTPAGQAGVRPGDVVLKIDSTSIRTEDDIATALATKRPGDVVRINVQRGRQELTLDATLVAP